MAIYEATARRGSETQTLDLGELPWSEAWKKFCAFSEDNLLRQLDGRIECELVCIDGRDEDVRTVQAQIVFPE